jgi:apolipoprotein N-acyltransferase
MLGSGGLFGLCFPPASLHLLAWVVLAPALVVLRRAPTARRAAALAALLAVSGTCATVGWLPGTVAVYYQQPLWVGVALFAGVTLAMVVPPVVAFVLCHRLLAASADAAAPLAAAAAWVTAEYWRAHALTGNPWVLLGYSQAGVAPVVQVADLGGVYAVGFVVMAVNAALAEAALATRRDARRAGGAAAAGAAVLAAALVYGRAVLPPPGAPPAATPVAIVQGNLDLGSQWRPELYGRNLDAYLRLTVDALRASRPRLVVWPEATMTFFVEREPLYREAIARVLTPFDAELVAGGPRVADGAPETYYNSVFLLAPDGALRGRYDKERLLPFAEYFPFAGLAWLRRDFGRVRVFAPGAPTAPLPTAAGRAGVLVCNEALFPEPARARVAAGAQVLLALTNDTWTGSREFARIALDMTALRAVETRRWLVRASTWGPSAVVDPAGRVTAATDPAVATTLAGAVAARDDRTLYARVGDAFAFACIAATLLGVARALTRRGRPRRGGSSPTRAPGGR